MWIVVILETFTFEKVKRWTKWSDHLRKGVFSNWMGRAEDQPQWRIVLEIYVQQWTCNRLMMMMR